MPEYTITAPSTFWVGTGEGALDGVGEAVGSVGRKRVRKPFPMQLESPWVLIRMVPVDTVKLDPPPPAL